MEIVRSPRGDSEQQSDRGARLADRVNVREVLINLVIIVVQKLLLGIDQKVRGRITR